MNINLLLKAARKAQSKAYAPYSNFQVGAAIIDESNQVHLGCNIENAAYPIGCCAEQSAVASMIINGGHTIKHILVVGKPGEPCPPCGACRQIIFEHSEADTMIHLESSTNQLSSRTIDELLPEAFHHSQLDK